MKLLYLGQRPQRNLKEVKFVRDCCYYARSALARRTQESIRFAENSIPPQSAFGAELECAKQEVTTWRGAAGRKRFGPWRKKYCIASIHAFFSFHNCNFPFLRHTEHIAHWEMNNTCSIKNWFKNGNGLQIQSMKSQGFVAGAVVYLRFVYRQNIFCTFIYL